MNKQLDSFLSSYSRESREITLCLRKMILEVFPNAIEQINPKSKLIVFGLDKTARATICSIAPHMKHVNLIVAKGAKLANHAQILVGTGKCVRHIRFKSEEETDNPALRLLLQEAINSARREIANFR